jgi:hypothetical protein
MKTSFLSTLVHLPSHQEKYLSSVSARDELGIRQATDTLNYTVFELTALTASCIEHHAEIINEVLNRL